MLKIILLALSVLSYSHLSQATEHRVNAFNRFGKDVKWDGKVLPGLIQGLSMSGSLTVAQAQPFESFDPYTSRFADDLVYESLFSSDPANNKETMYALLARSVRFDDDLKYVIFELNQEARFQDDTWIAGSDVLYSIEVFRESSPERKEAYDAAVSKVSASNFEVRFDLKTTGQASRHALMMLASMKIVKPNTGAVKAVGGIPIKYTATGPYRLKTLGNSRMSFIYNIPYWGSLIGSRNGLFSLREIDVVSFGDARLARLWLAHGKANFYVEPHPLMAAALQSTFHVQNSSLTVQTEKTSLQTQKPALVFNLKRPLMRDIRIRRAIMLAYDSDDISSIYYGNLLKRPLHIAATSSVSPAGQPSQSVIEAMNSCALPEEAYADFGSYGHAQFAASGDRRARILKGQKLLQEAGFTLEGGQMKTAGSPVTIRLHAPGLDPKAIYHFEANLMRMGFDVYSGAKYEKPNDFDLYADNLGFVAKDGNVLAENLKLPDSPFRPCLKSLLRTINNNSPDTEAYKNSSEAFVRISEALQMFIFTGQPAERYFVRDQNLHVPTGFSYENAHLYGYSMEANDWRVSYRVPPNVPCADLSCVFGHYR